MWNRGPHSPVFVDSIEFDDAERAADAVLPRKLPFILGSTFPRCETPAGLRADEATGEGGVQIGASRGYLRRF